MNSRETANTYLDGSSFNYDSGSEQNVLAAPASSKMCMLRPLSKKVREVSRFRGKHSGGSVVTFLSNILYNENLIEKTALATLALSFTTFIAHQ